MSRSILHVIHSHSRGGAFRAAVSTAVAHSKSTGARHSIVSLVSHEDDPSAIELARQSGVQPYSGVSRADLESLMSQADIVQLEWWNTAEMDALLRSPLPAMRLVVWLHVGGHAVPQVVSRGLVSYVDRAVATSPYCAESPAMSAERRSATSRKVEMIYASTDLSRVTATRPSSVPGRFQVGYLGTVHFSKMYHRFVSLCSRVNVPHAVFLVAGNGGSEEEILEQAQAAGMSTRIRLCGYVENLSSFVADCDVFGYPLNEDTYASSECCVQEMMYAGIPVVALAHGGVKRLVIDGYTGFLAHSEREYCEALEFLAHHPDERERLGNNARDYARQMFGTERAAKRFASVYEQLMSEPKRARTWSDPPELLAGLASITPAEHESGALRYILSGDGVAPYYAVSRSAHEASTWLDADQRIARASVLEQGSVVRFARAYPDDPWLAFWQSLASGYAKDYAGALQQIAKAIHLGFPHWRIFWYAAEITNGLGLEDLSRQSIDLLRDREARPTLPADETVSFFPLEKPMLRSQFESA